MLADPPDYVTTMGNPAVLSRSGSPQSGDRRAPPLNEHIYKNSITGADGDTDPQVVLGCLGSPRRQNSVLN